MYIDSRINLNDFNQKHKSSFCYSSCKEKIADYDSEIEVFNSDIHGTYAHLSRNSCLSEDFKNSFEQSFYEREVLIQKRYRDNKRLGKVERILI